MSFRRVLLGCFSCGPVLVCAAVACASPSFDALDDPEPAEAALAAAVARSGAVVPADAGLDVRMAPSGSWAGIQTPGGQDVRGLAGFTARIGTPAFVGQMLLAGYAAGQILRAPQLSASSARVAGAVLAAAVMSEGLHFASTRAGVSADPRGWRAFSGGERWLTSGDVTVAFAAASAIHAETGSRWAALALYPAAAAVGVSQLRETPASTGEVLMGAALGAWTGRAVVRYEHRHARFLDNAQFLARGNRRDFRVGLSTKF